MGRRTKEVVDYVGAPEALRELEQRIDAVAGAMRWISATPEVILDLQRDGLNAAGKEGAEYLRAAVRRGDLKMVDALLRANADPSAGGMPPLFFATDAAVIRRLIAAGADVNAVAEYGGPLLTWTVQRGRAEPVALLLQAGARVNTKNSQGETALLVATRLAAAPVPPPFPGEPTPPPREFDRITALLRAAGGK